jgi:hypothetical protein
LKHIIAFSFDEDSHQKLTNSIGSWHQTHWSWVLLRTHESWVWTQDPFSWILMLNPKELDPEKRLLRFGLVVRSTRIGSWRRTYYTRVLKEDPLVFGSREDPLVFGLREDPSKFGLPTTHYFWIRMLDLL